MANASASLIPANASTGSPASAPEFDGEEISLEWEEEEEEEEIEHSIIVDLGDLYVVFPGSTTETHFMANGACDQIRFGKPLAPMVRFGLDQYCSQIRNHPLTFAPDPDAKFDFEISRPPGFYGVVEDLPCGEWVAKDRRSESVNGPKKVRILDEEGGGPKVKLTWWAICYETPPEVKSEVTD